MGYLVNAVATGLEYADKYRVPEMLNKARCSSNAVDMTVTKIDTLIREKGTPLIKNIDSKLDTSITTVTEKKAEVVALATKKKAAAVEFATAKATIVTVPVKEQTAKITARVETAKAYTIEQANEAKTKLVEKAQKAVTASKSKMDVVQTKAINGKAWAEKELLVGAQKVDKVLKVDGITEKAASYAVQTTDSCLAYSVTKATQMVQIALALPAKAEKAVEYTKETTAKTTAYVKGMPSKAMIFLIAAKATLMSVPTTVIAKKDTLMTSFQKGDFQKDAQALYTTYKKVATEKAMFYKKAATDKATLAKAKLMTVYTAAGPKVDSYVKKAKQAIAQTTEKAKVEVSKLKPLIANFQEKVMTYPLLVQAKEKVATILSSMKAKTA